MGGGIHIFIISYKQKFCKAYKRPFKSLSAIFTKIIYNY